MHRSLHDYFLSFQPNFIFYFALIYYALLIQISQLKISFSFTDCAHVFILPATPFPAVLNQLLIRYLLLHKVFINLKYKSNTIASCILCKSLIIGLITLYCNLFCVLGLLPHTKMYSFRACLMILCSGPGPCTIFCP